MENKPRHERKSPSRRHNSSSSIVTQQAQAVGAYFSATPFTAIHASPLKRAFCTAQAIQDAQPAPKPPLETSLLLREQHFGAGEGKSWTTRPPPGMSREEQYAQGIFAILDSKFDRFPEGESLDDLARRAEEAVKVIILPYVWKAAREGRKDEDVKIAVVSHGLCISEIVAALVRMDAGGQGRGRDFKGLRNTAWTRVTIDVKVRILNLLYWQALYFE
jgi:broad specificity phosphatase PhoE